MKSILQNIVYFVAGYVHLWMLLFLWGFSAGLAAPYPYYALIGCLTLILLGSTTALFMEKIAATVALISSLLMLIWPLGGIFEEDASIQLLSIILIPPVLVFIDGTIRLIQKRTGSWTETRKDLSQLKRFIVITVNMIILASTIDVRMIFLLVFSGPQIH